MGERYMGTFLPMVDTLHSLSDFPDLAFMPSRLGVEGTAGMRKALYWEYLIVDKFLQILPRKVSNHFCPENSRTLNLLSHLDDLVGTPQ